MAKIMIDAGHGGHDPGAVGRHTKEKDNVLKVGLRLKLLLESYGHTVKMTRSTDVYLTLSERARLANAWGADYFVSLHNNAASASARGFETFTHNGALQSKTLAFQDAVHAAIAPYIGTVDRGKKRANYAVLRETKMSALLIEYAFISNVNDELILISESEKLAQLTANGIISYVGGTKPATPKPMPPKEDIEMAPRLLNDTGREEAKKLIRKAVESGFFKESHLLKLDSYTDADLISYSIAYVNRTTK